MPGLTYTEKDSTFVNLEGRVQRTREAGTATPGQAREDWSIVRAIAESVGRPLPYSDLNGVRARLADIAPHFAEVGKVQPASFATPVIPVKLQATTTFQPFFTNYYMTDPISRNSKIMAKCSAELPTARNSYI